MVETKLRNLRPAYLVLGRFNGKHSPIFSYTVLRIVKKLEEEYTVLGETLEALQKDYCKLDNQGVVVVDEDNQVQFENEEKEKEYNEKANELLNTKIEIDCPKITLSQLANENVQISPSELALIEDFVEIDV